VEYALLAVQQGDEGPVAELRQRALEDDELSLVILETLIQHDIDSYRLRQALHELTLYLSRRPDDLQAQLGRGYVWERLQHPADALENYRIVPEETSMLVAAIVPVIELVAAIGLLVPRFHLTAVAMLIFLLGA